MIKEKTGNDYVHALLRRLMARPLLYYLFNSVIVTVLDSVIVWILYRILSVDLIISNTTGVIIGFIVHYILSAKAVFKTKYDLVSFIVYLATFLIGLAFADYLIYIGENNLFLSANADLRFFLSKGISIVLPFFLLYFIRRIIFNCLRSRNKQHM
jgi:putative flippase GtrA